MNYFYHPEEREQKPFQPGLLSRTFWGAGLMLAVVDLEANTLLARHSHPHEQASFVVAGELDFTVGGETRHLKPGDICIIPGGVEHWVQVGPQPAQVLDIFHPAREEFKY